MPECKCGTVHRYSKIEAWYFDTNDRRVQEPGAWCNWCNSGYLCGTTDACRIVYVNDEGLPKSCCLNCYKNVPENNDNEKAVLIL